MVHSYNGVGCLQQGGCEVIDNDIISVAPARMQTRGDDGGPNFCVDGNLGDFGDDDDDRTESDIDDENSGGGDDAVEMA